MKRINSRFYTTEKIKYMNDGLKIIDNDGYLFSQGIYPTKLKEEDLPEYFIEGQYFRKHGFLSALGVKDLKYVPNMNVNHMFKDDFLYISYEKPIIESKKSNLLDRFENYDTYIWGWNIIEFLKGVEKYSDYDISKIREEIERKRKHFKENYPNDYKLEVLNDNLWE